MIAPVTHILPLSSVRRARLLEDRGNVLVRVGQEISAVDVVAEAPARRKHILLDVPSALGLTRDQFSKDLLTRKVGDKLEEGDVLAEAKKLLRRVVRAPVNSEIIMISGGMVLLEVQDDPIMLRAGLSGTVVEVIPDRGVILETTGALIQGVWGNGKINLGLLMVLVGDPLGEISADHLDISMRGAVVMLGHCKDVEILKAAQELPLHGLIIGSMSSDLIPTAQQIDLPVIVLEGFGKIPMNQAAFKILSTNEKRDISLNATPLNYYLGERPELIIPLPATGQFPPETDEFKFGQTVRILSAPHMSAMGTIAEVHYEPVLLANGLRARAATIRLENNEHVPVPLNNLEVIE